jgi:hypothetical protein
VSFQYAKNFDYSVDLYPGMALEDHLLETSSTYLSYHFIKAILLLYIINEAHDQEVSTSGNGFSARILLGFHLLD